MDVREKLSNERRLIDSDEARRRIIAFATGLHSEVLPVDTVMMLLIQMPDVDAVEVVHGRWEEMHYEGGILDGTNFDRCSVCGYERVFDDPALKTVFKYCPNCGAKMDGGDD